MFSRRPLYHPYKPSTPKSSPAGFRLGDYVNPRRILEGLDFADMHSPDPSPLNSPIKGLRPLTQGLSSIPFMPGGFQKPPREKPQPPTPILEEQNPRPKSQVPRKAKLGHKHLSYTKRHDSSGAHHRHSQKIKEKRSALYKRMRDQQRAARAHNVSRLRREAEKTMQPEHMNDEDRIFLQQLRNLELEDDVVDSLERYREQTARAAADADKRKKEQKERDREAAELWDGRNEEEASEEQRRKVAEFVQANEERQQAELQQMEEEAARAYEERQRARNARERRIGEEKEQRYREELAHKAKERQRRHEERLKRQEERRQRDEQERQTREEGLGRLGENIQRFKRENEAYERSREQQSGWRIMEKCRGVAAVERERIAEEEHEQQAHLVTEKAERERQQLLQYEAKWNELQTNQALSLVDVSEVPWPVFGIVSSAAQITAQNVRTFITHPQRPGVEDKTTRNNVEAEVLRFHPDNFNTHVLPKINVAQQADAKVILGAVEKILADIMNEEAE